MKSETPDPDGQTVLEKRALRQRVLNARDQMSSTERASESARCIARLLELDAYRQSQMLLAYVGFSTEIDTLPLLAKARADGKIVVLPRMLPRSASRPASLALHRVDRDDDLVAGLWGIREPAADAPGVELAALDLIVIPGVAFDANGGRLGYGKGYYDQLLLGRRDRNSRRPTVVALAFECQIIDVVPMTDRDEKIDVLITSQKTFDFRT